MPNEYELQPEDIKTMVQCPRCLNFNCFRLYENVETKEVLPAYVGECTRAICGHKHSWRRYFRKINEPVKTQV
ncbi:MAG: hypothetical protein JWQ09_1785 [Segetibacter sp.]|nr:hypothetical protein [Segetibacter sp.]